MHVWWKSVLVTLYTCIKKKLNIKRCLLEQFMLLLIRYLLIIKVYIERSKYIRYIWNIKHKPYKNTKIIVNFMLKFQACFFLSLGEGHKCTRYFFFFFVWIKDISRNPLICFVCYKEGKKCHDICFGQGKWILTNGSVQIHAEEWSLPRR